MSGVRQRRRARFGQSCDLYRKEAECWITRESSPQIHPRGPAGEVAKTGSEPLPPPICLRTLGPKEGSLLFGSILARETQKLHKAEWVFTQKDTPATYTLKTKFLVTSTVSWMYFYYYFIPWSIYLTYTEFYNCLLSQKWPKNSFSAFSNEMQRKPSSPTKSLEKIFAYSTILEASKRKWTIFLKQQNTRNLRWHTTAAM